jgi:hypothetical protein
MRLNAFTLVFWRIAGGLQTHLENKCNGKGFGKMLKQRSHQKILVVRHVLYQLHCKINVTRAIHPQQIVNVLPRTEVPIARLQKTNAWM